MSRAAGLEPVVEFVGTNGIRLSVARLGPEHGPPVVLLHGSGEQAVSPRVITQIGDCERTQRRPHPVRWQKDPRENRPVQWRIFEIRPSLTSLSRFRDRLAPLHQDLNRQVVRAAIAKGHTDGACGALDGTSVAANATRDRMVSLETVEKRLR
jgi:hypothetical protein